MQILGDAGALPFQRPFLLQMLQPALNFSFFHNTHDTAHRKHENQSGQRDEPPRLPEMPHYNYIQPSLVTAPYSVTVARGYAKTIIPGGQVAVKPCGAS